ncbi:MAG: hypothetical protein R3E79_25885 [Caldilineaceae bacterium]
MRERTLQQATELQAQETDERRLLQDQLASAVEAGQMGTWDLDLLNDFSGIARCAMTKFSATRHRKPSGARRLPNNTSSKKTAQRSMRLCAPAKQGSWIFPSASAGRTAACIDGCVRSLLL